MKRKTCDQRKSADYQMTASNERGNCPFWTTQFNDGLEVDWGFHLNPAPGCQGLALMGVKERDTPQSGRRLDLAYLSVIPKPPL